MLVQIDNLLTSDELQHTLHLTETADWHSGQHSAGLSAAAQKNNLEMNQNSDQWKQINQLVLQRLYQNADFQSTVLPHRMSAAFVSRYTAGMGYKTHIDDPVMGTPSARYRCDIAVTVFLSNPASYEGGELIIHTRFGPNRVKLPAGSAVAYPASSLHEVTTVETGERLACVLWAQSLIRDANQREIIADLDDARRALKLTTPKAQVTAKVDQAYMNLVRLWSEV